MIKKDEFSRLLGMEVEHIAPGKSILKMLVRKDMLNGFGILHGGVTFSLADSALAFASNSYGRLSVAVEASISFPSAAKEGDMLRAVANEINLSNKMGVYIIDITNQNNERIGIFKGTVYRTSKEILPE
jgi:acyl-CoA thioesterase